MESITNILSDFLSKIEELLYEVKNIASMRE